MHVRSRSTRLLLVAALSALVLAAAACTTPSATITVPGSATIVFPPQQIPIGDSAFYPVSSTIVVCVGAETAVRVTWQTPDGNPIYPVMATLVFNGVTVGSYSSLGGPYTYPMVTQPFGPGCGEFAYSADRPQFLYGPSVNVTFEAA